LNELPTNLLEGVELEFVGRATKNFAPERVEALLSESARGALRGISFETELDQHEALERLSRPATVAVIPSLEDNSPMVVYECMERGIPFLASAAGGTSELIAPEDRPRVLFSPTVDGVAAALERVLTEEVAPAPARTAFDGEASLERWSDLLATEPR